MVVHDRRQERRSRSGKPDGARKHVSRTTTGTSRSRPGPRSRFDGHRAAISIRGLPGHLVRRHCINFLEYKGTVYLYDACFGFGSVEIQSPLPPDYLAVPQGAALAVQVRLPGWGGRLHARDDTERRGDFAVGFRVPPRFAACKRNDCADGEHSANCGWSGRPDVSLG